MRWRVGGDADARDQLVERYLGFSRSLARRFVRHGEPIDDLEQVAALGLVKAIDRYDLHWDVAITTYATPAIIGELRKHYRDRVWAVHVPRPVQELAVRVARATDDLTWRLARTPAVADVARELDRSEADVRDAIGGLTSRHAQSIWAWDGEERDVLATLGGEDPGFGSVEDRMMFAPALRDLGARDRAILRLRFVDGLSQDQIATRIGISQMHVSRLLRRALAQIGATLSLG